MTKTTRVRAVALIAAGLTGAALLTACGSSSDALGTGNTAAGTVVVTSETFPENVLLGNMYLVALKSIGVPVKDNLSVGSRELYLKDMESGASSLVPEYTGNLLLQYDPAATAASSAEVYSALPTALPKTLGVLDYAPAEDKDSLALTQATSDKYSLTSMDQLAPLCGQLTIGAAPTLQTRQAGLLGLTSKYGCTFKAFSSLDSGGPLTLQALLAGSIDVANLYTTDSAIADNKLVLLKDPKNVFPAQNIVPLYHDGALTQPAKDKLNEVSKALDTETLASLLRKVTVDQTPAVTVATDWLKSKGLISG